MLYVGIFAIPLLEIVGTVYAIVYVIIGFPLLPFLFMSPIGTGCYPIEPLIKCKK